MNIYGIQEPFPDGPKGETLVQRLDRFDAWFDGQRRAGSVSEEDGALAALYRLDLKDCIARGDDVAPKCPFGTAA
jgi:hypothetical protein